LQTKSKFRTAQKLHPRWVTSTTSLSSSSATLHPLSDTDNCHHHLPPCVNLPLSNLLPCSSFTLLEFPTRAHSTLTTLPQLLSHSFGRTGNHRTNRSRQSNCISSGKNLQSPTLPKSSSAFTRLSPITQKPNHPGALSPSSPDSPPWSNDSEVKTKLRKSSARRREIQATKTSAPQNPPRFSPC
jgi:hypothetical protein